MNNIRTWVLIGLYCLVIGVLIPENGWGIIPSTFAPPLAGLLLLEVVNAIFPPSSGKE